MERIDIAILAVGAFVLVASVIGVIVYEPAGGAAFRVSFVAGTEDGLDAPEDQSGGASTYTFTVTANGTDIVDIHFDVTATTGGARLTADEVAVTVRGPGGLAGEGSFSMAAGPTGAGTTRVTVHVRDVPQPALVSAADAESARAAAEASRTPWTDGAGEWTIEVTVTGGASAPGPASPTYNVGVEPFVQRVEAGSATPDAPDIRG